MGPIVRRFRWILAAAAGCAVVLACSKAATRQAPAAATKPASLFPHAKHAENDLACTDCHAPEGWKEGAYEPRRPTWDKCKECHEDDDKDLPSEKKVHDRFFDAAGRPKGPTSFDKVGGDVMFRHAPHAKAADCVACHGDLDGPRRSGPMFTKSQCMTCHTQKGASTDCATCHREIRKEVPPESHRHLWRERHGGLVRSADEVAQQYCDLCHTRPNFCADCHRDTAPRNHTELFRHTTHGFLAATDRNSCRTCHDTDFCERCHSETAPRSHRGSWMHGPSFHCADCHLPLSRDESCRVCHKSAPHDSATPQPDWHTPGMNCRLCHLPSGTGPGGAPAIPHVDVGLECALCHKR